MREVSRLVVSLLLAITVAGLAENFPPTDSAYIVCGKNAYFGSGVSQVSFQLRYGIDATGTGKVQAMQGILIIAGSNIMSVDTTVVKAYTGSGVSHFAILSVGKDGKPSPAIPPFYMVYQAVNFTGGVTGESLWANIVINVDDTGTICVDTVSTAFPEGPLLFIDELAQGYSPTWAGGQCCQVELYPPGDVNLDKKVNIIDVVATVGYVFRNRKPASVQAADVNADCLVSLADIIYLANYTFKGTAAPLAGCLQ